MVCGFHEREEAHGVRGQCATRMHAGGGAGAENSALVSAFRYRESAELSDHGDDSQQQAAYISQR